jgi:L-fuculose-phosphate aldolase
MDLIAAGARVAALGLSWGTSGNISRRLDDEQFEISASGTRLGELDESCITACEIDGERWVGELAPSVETGMHRGVYQARPDVGAVLHSSPFHTTLIASSAIDVDITVTTDALLYVRGVTRVGFVRPGTAELADAVTRAVAAADIVLLDHHGCLVAGESVDDAVNRTEALEELCRMLVAEAQGFPLRRVDDPGWF